MIHMILGLAGIKNYILADFNILDFIDVIVDFASFNWNSHHDRLQQRQTPLYHNIQLS